MEIGQRGALLFRDEFVFSFKNTERKRVTRRLFGTAGFVQVILTSAGNLAPSCYFVDMILRRLNYGASIWICLTKSDGGHYRGTPPSSAALSCISSVAYHDNKESAKQSSDLEAR